MSSGTRRRGTDLEDAVYAATLAELAAHGMAGLTFERIAERARAGKTSLYRRWADIDELVLAALAREEDRAKHSPHPAGTRLEPTGDLRSELLAFLGGFADRLSTPVGRALTPLMLEQDRRPDLWNRVLELVVEPRQRLVREALERAAGRGEIPPGSVTPARVSAGPALVLARHFTAGRALRQDDVIEILDDVVLPALRG